MLVPVIGGAAAGRAAMSAVVSGSMNVAQELGPESMPAAARRSAKEIAKVFSPAFVKPGWIPPEKAKAQYQRADDPVARCELCEMDHQGHATAIELVDISAGGKDR